MREWMNRHAFLIIFVIFGGVGGTLYYVHHQDSVGRMRVDQALFHDYFAAIAAEDFAKARGRWQPDRQALYTADDMARHYRAMRERSGAFKEYQIRAVRGSLVDVQLFYASELIAVTYTIAETPAGGATIAAAAPTTFRAALADKPW